MKFKQRYMSMLFVLTLDCTANYVIYGVIDKTNCELVNTLTVTKENRSINLNVKITSEIVATTCLVYIVNSAYEANKVYTISAAVFGNTTTVDSFSVDIFAGDPYLNKPLKSLNSLISRWTGHLPSWDVYFGIFSSIVTDFTVILTIKECMENCFQLKTPSIIPTKIVDITKNCGKGFCLDDNAVSYVIRTASLQLSQCSLYFLLRNEPEVCFTIGDHRNIETIKTVKCRNITIKIEDVVYATFDRMIYKPWCLPWHHRGTTLSISIKNDEYSEGIPCDLQLFTNTTNKGGHCEIMSTTSANKFADDDNSTMVAGVTVALIAVLILSVFIAVFSVLMRKFRLRNTGSPQIVANFHNHSSVQVIAPPPYSVAIEGSNFHQNADRTNSASSTSLPVLSLPPYSVRVEESTASPSMDGAPRLAEEETSNTPLSEEHSGISIIYRNQNDPPPPYTIT